MSIKSDRWIRRMARERRMIEPVTDKQVREGVISYGLSSYGYDVRIADEFKIFTNINSTIVDPKNFDPRSFVDFKGDVCIIPPNSFALAQTVEYFRIPRSVIVVCLGKSTYARCFRGDQRVALVDGTSMSLEDMAHRAYKGEDFWGYSIGEFGRVSVTKLEAPRFVGRDALLEIVLDSGAPIRCTPDHVLVRRDGTSAPAGELRPGDSLMPLYRQLVRGHEAVYQPIDGRLTPTHRLADEWNLRHGVHTRVAGPHRHHRCHDRRNSNPSDATREAHRARTSRRHADPAERERQPRLARQMIGAFRGRAARNHKIESIRELPGDHDVYCLTVPEAGNFALEAGVFVSNCGIIVNVTPLEPEWEGIVTLEVSNTTPLPAKIYANEGIAQVLFFESDEECETSYADKKGKYQAQKKLTLPRL